MRIVIAITLLPHPALGQASFGHLKRPMILVSYSSIEPFSLSIWKKEKERSSSSSSSLTLSCNAGYIDHDLSLACALDFVFLLGLGFLLDFGFEDDMLNSGLVNIKAQDDSARGRGEGLCASEQ